MVPKPTRNTVIVIAPIKVHPRPPTPPVMDVPPITTAAILGSSRLSAMVGLPLELRATIAIPANPANNPVRAKPRIFTRATRMPESSATLSAMPIA